MTYKNWCSYCNYHIKAEQWNWGGKATLSKTT